MRRIAVINQKGGVGKTTTTANLGAAAARAGLRVLLIDLDPQAHLSLHFGVELNDDQPSVYDVLTTSMPVQEVALHVRDRVTLVPADIDLSGAETELVTVTGREVLLREALEAVEEDYDCLLIDGPPSLGILTVNALVAANEVMIPLQAHFLALQGLSRLLDTVTLVRQRINPSLTVGGIVLCLHESTTRLAGEVVEDLVKFLEAARGTNLPWADATLYETYVRRNIKLAESSSFGQTVFDYAPRSNGAADYARLAAEVFGVAVISPRPAANRGPTSEGATLLVAPDKLAPSTTDQPGMVPANDRLQVASVPVKAKHDGSNDGTTSVEPLSSDSAAAPTGVTDAAATPAQSPPVQGRESGVLAHDTSP